MSPYQRPLSYAMVSKYLGLAIIVNNVLNQFPGTQKDVDALENCFDTIGFKWHTRNNLSQTVNALNLPLGVE